MSAAESLSTVASALAAGAIEVVDLTAPLGPDTPVLYLPPEFGRNTPRFKMNEISAYDANGPWWAWGWMELGEHTGTHFDAPAHWISGRDRPDNTTDKLPPKDFVAPVCVIDCSAQVAADPGFILTADGVKAWEAEHGEIPAGAWVFMRSDWYPRNTSSEAFLNGGQTPGPSVDCIRYLVDKNVAGWGSECVGTDAGMAHSFDPPFPAHHLLLEKGRYGLASLVNLDKLPATGALVVAAPLKIVNGTGSPVRVIALVPKS
ncbi:cyclase family protein [Aureimonas sp. AU4]|uniref:cyclase family protein n=1 Tax=Aureimonas sp. AU4 TaxID=1638163 RepID=UPI000781AB6C|nr:cyclase family protein [Aureimonas sp. AU4]